MVKIEFFAKQFALKNNNTFEQNMRECAVSHTVVAEEKDKIHAPFGYRKV